MDNSLGDYLGINFEYYLIYMVLGLAALILILFILLIINIIQNRKLKKKFKSFMLGKDGESLEENLVKRISQIEDLAASNKENNKKLDRVSNDLKSTFQKMGMVKYDAFHEMGGKLSFSLAMLNQEDDGFIINAMHSREGCYTYVKEIVKGNSILILSEEEKEALDIAMGTKL